MGTFQVIRFRVTASLRRPQIKQHTVSSKQLYTSFKNIVAAFRGCMCRLRNIAMRDYQESVINGETHERKDGQTDGRRTK